MIKYGDLVQYIRRNHINWDRDLFDILRGFFEQYSQQLSLPSHPPVQQELIFEHIEDFKAPDNGEYTNEDLLNLFST